MKAARVLFAVVAFATMPFVALAAQGNSEACNADQARSVAEMRRNGKPVPPGLAKKCPPPAPVPPPPSAPPVGPHKALGNVFDDLDGNGSRDAFAGEGGLSGWSVQLFYQPSGALVATVATDGSGNFEFSSLGSGTWFVCIVAQGGYSQTFPMAGSACGGRGHQFTISGSIETWVMNNDFGMMLQ